MALTDSSRFYDTNVTDLSDVLSDFSRHFEGKGYEVVANKTSVGAFISITKGGLFKSIIGMKTALNIDLEFADGGIKVKMQVGAFGRQILPTALVLLGTWIILLPQLVGLIEQYKLDEEAYDVIEASLRGQGGVTVVKTTASEYEFCTDCGKKNPIDAVFCGGCGKRLREADITCPECGKTLPAGTAFCTGCGAKLV